MKFFRCCFKQPKTKKNMCRACLPFIVAKTKQEADEIINGNIPFIPAIPIDKQHEIKSKIPADMLAHGITEQAGAHKIYDISDFSSKALFLGTIRFVDESFVPIDPRWKNEGDYAIVIIKPLDFIAQINGINGLMYPNYKIIEEGSMTYDDRLNKELDAGFSFNPFVKQSHESWKNELAIVSRTKSSIAIIDSKRQESTDIFSVGKLDSADRKIAVCVPMQALIEGRFPKEILNKDITDFVSQFKDPVFPKLMMERIAISCNIQDIGPYEKWINSVCSIFTKDDWVPLTGFDRAPENKTIPILMFRKTDASVEIKFHTNLVEISLLHGCSFLLSKLLDYLEKDIKTKFAGVSVSRSYNLGKAPVNDKWISFDVRKTIVKEGINYTYFLTKDSVAKPDVFGFSSTDDVYWRFEEEIADKTAYLWYGADEIEKFCKKAEEKIEQKAAFLVGGDTLGKYRGI